MIKIRKYEWEILRVNLIRSGVSGLDASRIIDNHIKLMDDWYEKLKEKIKSNKITEEDADKLFKSKFWKMAQRWEN